MGKQNIKKVLETIMKQETKKTWSESIDDMIKVLKRKRKLKDRLDYAELMMEILNTMTFSLNGWNQWGNIYRLNRLSEDEYKDFVPKEYKDFVPKLLEVAIKWLEIDRDLTSRKEKEIEKSVEVERQEELKSRETYVS